MRSGIRAALALAAVVASMMLTTGAAAATPGPPHLAGCNESGDIRPRWYNPICNDGAWTVIKPRWSRWSGSAARGLAGPRVRGDSWGRSDRTAADQPDNDGDERHRQQDQPASLDPLERPEAAARLVPGP